MKIQRVAVSSEEAVSKYKEIILSQLNNLIKNAEAVNFVLEVNVVSKQPPAMGNYAMVSDIRERTKGAKILSDEEVKEFTDTSKKLNYNVYYFNWINETYLLCSEYNNQPLPYGVITEKQLLDIVEYVNE
jgi:uncharacterized protein YbaP (TraB family)